MSPVVLRVGPYRFLFFAGDAPEPPHVHVASADATAKFWLAPRVALVRTLAIVAMSSGGSSAWSSSIVPSSRSNGMSSSPLVDLSGTVETRTRAVAARVHGERLWVDTADGRTIGVPIDRFPWLAQASLQQRASVSLYGGGYVLLWDELDEAVSVLQLFGLPH